MTDEYLYAIRQRMSERPLLSFAGLPADDRERVRWAFQDRRDLLTEAIGLHEERKALRDMLADLVETCARPGSPDGPTRAGCSPGLARGTAARPP